MNGCSKKLCPMQVGTTDNCMLTKEQCPYYTQRQDHQKEIRYFVENEGKIVCIDHELVKEANDEK